MMDYYSLLLGKKFVGLSGYNVAEYFKLQSEYYKYGVDFASHHNFRKLLSNLLFCHYEVRAEIFKDAKIIFMYTYGNTRRDYYNITDSVSYSSSKCSRIYIDACHKFNVCITIKLLWLSLFWLCKALTLPIKVKYKYDIVAQIIDIYRFKTSIENISLIQYKYVSVYCDISSMEQIFMQYARKYGNIKIITLQHGFFSAEQLNPTSLEISGYALKNSKADIFLAWNELTKLRLQKVGRNSDSIFVLGLPQYANRKKPIVICPHNRRFGLLLGGEYAHEENRKLIEIANLLAKTINYHYVLKVHPQSNIDFYDELVNNDFCELIIGRERTIEELSADVEFTILSGNSSVFIELVFLGITCFCFESTNDLYPEVKINRFKNEKDIIKLLNNKDIVCNNKTLFNQICSKENPQKEYTEFFNCILK